MNACLITWEGTDLRLTEINKIAGVLSGRSSSSDVERIVDFIYHRSQFSVGDMVYYANRRKARESRSRASFSTRARIFYGSNPWLYARMVKELRVEADESEGIEIVSWTEHALVANNASTGYTFVETEPERHVSIRRPLHSPIAKEPVYA